MRSPLNFPRFMAGGSIFACFALMGNGLHRWCGHPLPGTVNGLSLLASGSAIIRRASAPKIKSVAETVEPLSNLLLTHMGLLFVPAGTAIVTEGDILRRNWLPILAALIVSTVLGIATCGWIM